MNLNPPMVRVEWTDSTCIGSDAWTDLATVVEVGPPQTRRHCVTVGFCIHKTRTTLTIVSSIMGLPIESGDHGAGNITIPRCAIHAIKELR